MVPFVYMEAIIDSDVFSDWILFATLCQVGRQVFAITSEARLSVKNDVYSVRILFFLAN